MALGGTRWHSVALRGTHLHRLHLGEHDQWQSVAISGNQWQSVALSGTQCQSVAIRGTHLHRLHLGEHEGKLPLAHPKGFAQLVAISDELIELDRSHVQLRSRTSEIGRETRCMRS